MSCPEACTRQGRTLTLPSNLLLFKVIYNYLTIFLDILKIGSKFAISIIDERN